jgi:hypothetical protein
MHAECCREVVDSQARRSCSCTGCWTSLAYSTRSGLGVRVAWKEQLCMAHFRQAREQPDMARRQDCLFTAVHGEGERGACAHLGAQRGLGRLLDGLALLVRQVAPQALLQVLLLDVAPVGTPNQAPIRKCPGLAQDAGNTSFTHKALLPVNEHILSATRSFHASQVRSLWLKAAVEVCPLWAAPRVQGAVG